MVFQARLSDPQTGRKFWVGGGQTNSGGGGLIGAISISNGVNAASIASNIFNDLRAKELIGAAEAHPHMLRHACGYALANKGHDTRALRAYLGHRNIQHTVRYTELSPTRFKDFWRN
jgi:integrase